MKRLLTAAVGASLGLWALFALPSPVFFWVVAALFCLAAWEYTRILAHWAPTAPRWVVIVLIPLVALALAPGQRLSGRLEALPWVALVLSVGVGVLVLLVRTAVEESAPAMGGLAFGALYMGLPIAALSELQNRSPWLLFLLLAIVWLGDSAAFYFGTRFGRHQLAPVVSPNKSWEGAIAAVVVSGVVAVAWSAWRDARIDVFLLLLALLTSVAAQLGDLVESSLKRGAGIKDSGNLLPGHGGFLDRLDALAFAAPVWWFALELGARLPSRP